jgi:hypothetical protein
MALGYLWLRYALYRAGPSALGRNYRLWNADLWMGVLAVALLLALQLVAYVCLGAPLILHGRRGPLAIGVAALVVLGVHFMSPTAEVWRRKVREFDNLSRGIRARRIRMAWLFVAAVVSFLLASFWMLANRQVFSACRWN